jgi:hypothetical protein
MASEPSCWVQHRSTTIWKRTSSLSKPSRRKVRSQGCPRCACAVSRFRTRLSTFSVSFAKVHHLSSSVFVYRLNEEVGQLHLHPISETHQLRPTLTYLDILSRKTKRPRADAGTDSESDDGPPPDPDEPASAPSPKHRDKNFLSEAREAQVTARKAEDKGGPQMFGGLSTVRREILSMVRAEDEEHWQDLEFCGLEVPARRSFPLLLG